MTRKDYKIIAGVVAKVNGWWSTTEATRIGIAHELADALARDNPRFDRGKFFAACKLPTGKPLAS